MKRCESRAGTHRSVQSLPSCRLVLVARPLLPFKVQSNSCKFATSARSALPACLLWRHERRCKQLVVWLCLHRCNSCGCLCLLATTLLPRRRCPCLLGRPLCQLRPLLPFATGTQFYHLRDEVCLRAEPSDSRRRQPEHSSQHRLHAVFAHAAKSGRSSRRVATNHVVRRNDHVGRCRRRATLGCSGCGRAARRRHCARRKRANDAGGTLKAFFLRQRRVDDRVYALAVQRQRLQRRVVQT